MSQNLVSEQAVFDALKKAIVETLRVDAQRIKPDTYLVDDLDAESLDFLDINYRLEQTFGIKMARHFVLEHIEEMFGEETAIDDEGRLTEKAVQVLKIRFGEDMAELEPGMDMDEVPSLITVDSMIKAVMDILNTLPETCNHCSESAWKLEAETHIKCGACGEPAIYTNGDDLTQQWLQYIQSERNLFA